MTNVYKHYCSVCCSGAELEWEQSRNLFAVRTHLIGTSKHDRSISVSLVSNNQHTALHLSAAEFSINQQTLPLCTGTCQPAAPYDPHHPPGHAPHRPVLEDPRGPSLGLRGAKGLPAQLPERCKFGTWHRGCKSILDSRWIAAIH